MSDTQHEGGQQCPPSDFPEDSVSETPSAPPVRYWRPAEEPTCCGSGCIDCPF